MKFGIALQVYSVRELAANDLKGTLTKIKEMGYEGVEFAGLYGHSPEEVKDMLAALGLTPVSAHVAIDDMLTDPDKVIAGYATIGCKFIAVPYLQPERRPGTDGFEKTLKDIETVAIAAKKYGITMLYHNHDFEFDKIDGKYALDILYDTISSDLLQTEIDTCWVNVGGEDPSAYVRKYTGRTPVVHLKDFYMKNRDKNAQLYDLIGIQPTAKKGRDGDFEFRPVGYGVQDFPSILKASEEAGAAWVIVEQDQPSLGKNPLECAEMSIEYLRKLGISR